METGVIFTCKYFKFGLNTTGLSQSHFRNLSACSITTKILVLRVINSSRHRNCFVWGYIHSLFVSKALGGGTPLCDLNGDVRPDRVWFSGCFVLNGVSVSSLSVLNRVSVHYLMA